MKLKILTYATHEEGYYKILAEQLKKLSHDYKIIGFNKKWQGFYQRFYDFYKYLNTQDDNLIILFTDGFDSIILENEKTILKKYLSYNKKIVYGIEDLQNTIKKLSQKIVFTNEKYVINGGSYIGQNKYLKKMFKNILDIYGKDNLLLDDQMIINHYINSNCEFVKKYIGIDIDIKIFANMSNLHSYYYLFGISKSNYIIDKKNNKIINSITKCQPSVISGCSNFDMSVYTDFLGYNKDLFIKRNYSTFMIKNIINYYKTYCFLQQIKI